MYDPGTSLSATNVATQWPASQPQTHSNLAAELSKSSSSNRQPSALKKPQHTSEPDDKADLADHTRELLAHYSQKQSLSNEELAALAVEIGWSENDVLAWYRSLGREYPNNSRPRMPSERDILMAHYARNKTPSMEEVAKQAKETGRTETAILTWYRSRRRDDPEYSAGDSGSGSPTRAGPPAGRKRIALTNHQLKRLEEEFAKDRSLSSDRRMQLAGELRLHEDKVLRWFENRRRTRKS